MPKPYPYDLIEVLRNECDRDEPLIIGPVFKTLIAALIDTVEDGDADAISSYADALWGPIL
jgi:hypothetical protein